MTRYRTKNSDSCIEKEGSKDVAEQMAESADVLRSHKFNMAEALDILKFHQDNCFQIPNEYGQDAGLTSAEIMATDLRILSPLVRGFHTEEVNRIADDLMFYSAAALSKIAELVDKWEDYLFGGGQNEWTDDKNRSSRVGMTLTYMVRDDFGNTPMSAKELKLVAASVEDMGETAFNENGLLYRDDVDQYVADATARAMLDCADAFDNAIPWLQQLSGEVTLIQNIDAAKVKGA